MSSRYRESVNWWWEFTDILTNAVPKPRKMNVQVLYITLTIHEKNLNFYQGRDHFKTGQLFSTKTKFWEIFV